jgi:hypothetical protein
MLSEAASDRVLTAAFARVIDGDGYSTCLLSRRVRAIAGVECSIFLDSQGPRDCRE